MKRAGIHFFILLIVIAVYWPVTGHGFVNWDDQVTIEGNKDFKPPTWAGVGRYWRKPAGELYVPVTYTAWGGIGWLAYEDGKLAASPFHWASVIGHAAAAMVVVEILILLGGSIWAGWAGGVMFAIHPVQVEAVAWASGFKDVLSGLLGLMAVWQYLVWGKSGKKIHYGVATVLFGLAMLAKPSAVVIPILAAWLGRGTWKKKLMELGAWVAMCVPVMIVAKWAQPAALVPRVGVIDRVRVAGDAIAFYLWKIVAPIHLAVDYGRAPDWVVGRGWTWGTCLVAGLLGVIVWRWRRVRCVTDGAGAFVIPLLPVLGFLPFSFQYFSTVADHYLYVAMLGVAIVVSCGLSRWPRVMPVFVVLMGVYGVMSVRQEGYWGDTKTLFEHNVEVNPGSLVAHRNLAYLAGQEGQWDEEVRQYLLALQTRPHDPDTQFNLGNYYFLQERDPAAAIPHYEDAVMQQPGEAAFHLNLGQALRAVGLKERGDREVNTAIRMGIGGN